MPLNQNVTPRMNPTELLSLGADVGSTTAKIAVLRGDEIVYTTYERHYSRIRETLVKMLEDARAVLGDAPFTAAISGSAGLGLAEGAGIPFVQEVWATGEVVKKLDHDVASVIELHPLVQPKPSPPGADVSSNTQYFEYHPSNV